MTDKPLQENDRNPLTDAETVVPSKTRRKQEAEKIKQLAMRLLDLSPSGLSRVPLDDSLRDEIREAGKMRSHGARKRQMLFIAKLLRRTDTTLVMEALDAMENDGRQATARQHRVEAWRDYLLDKGDEGLSQLLSDRHDVDIPALRALIRNARREEAASRPPASRRALFRLLRLMDENSPLPAQ
jgi:ribosome-associated protein